MVAMGIRILRALCWMVLVWVACDAAAALVRRQHAPPVVSGTLVPAAAGPLQVLAIQFHRPGSDRFLPVFEEILGALEPTTEVMVVVSDAEDEALFEAARRGWFVGSEGPKVHYTRTGRTITSWMRDRLAVLRGADGPALLAPVAPMTGPEARAHDWTVPWTLGAALDLPVRSARYRFDGGDFIADERRAYVSTALLTRNPGVAEQIVLGAVVRDLNMPVLRLGSTGAVPDHHIGMVIAPIGDRVVLVGDPDLALAALLESERASGRVEIGGSSLELDLDPERLERFGRVHRELEAAGRAVVRLPVLPSTTAHVWLSYANTLMERRSDGQLHVLMPTYGHPGLDAEATRVWESVGAAVHPVDVRPVFRLGGTVRCLVAPVRRGAVTAKTG